MHACLATFKWENQTAHTLHFIGFFIAVVILGRHRKSVSRQILLLLSWTLADLVSLSRVMMLLPLLLMEIDIRGYCSNSPLILKMFLKYIMPFTNSLHGLEITSRLKRYSHLLVTYGIYLIMYLTVYWFLGAIRIALGGAATGVFSNSSTLWQQLHQAGAVTGDRVWRFPLWDHFTKRMTGTVYLVYNYSFACILLR